MAERDLSDSSEEVKASTTPYGDVGRFYEINEPEVLIPSSVTADAESHSERRNIILSRHRNWALIKNWRTQSQHVDETYGPTSVINPSYTEDSQNFDYPEGLFSYANTYTPCGVYVDISPSVISLNITSCVINTDVPAPLIFDTSTGSIRGTPSAVAVRTRYIVSGITPYGNIRTAFFLTIFDPSFIPAIDYPNKAFAATGIAFSFTPNTWRIPNGVTATINPTLPSGLTFTASNGVISGTPTVVTNYANYQVRASGEPGTPVADNTYGDMFKLAVCGINYPSALYSFATTSIPINVAKTITPTRWTGISSATIVPTLPTGLSFTASNGVISGTPTVASIPTNYTIYYSGSSIFSGISDDVAINLSVCSVSHATPSAIHWEIIPITTSATDWPNGSAFNTFSAIYKVIDYRGSSSSSIMLNCGNGTTHKHPIKWIVERSTPYNCNIYLRNGSYPGFQMGTRNSSWDSIFLTSGMRGIRFISESTHGAKFQTGTKPMSFASVTGINISPWVVNVPGAWRDISFSGCYFSGIDAPGTYSLIQLQNVSSQVVPGLHFYDCHFDANEKFVKWIIRDYNADDHRFIRCKFTDNWYPSNPATEHAFYNTGDFGINFFEDCLFSGAGRNAVQLANYKDYGGGQPSGKPCPSSIGAWVIRNCSAIQCGMSSWKLIPGNNLPSYQNNGNGAVHFTIAGVSAVYMLGCMVSAGYHPVYGYENITKSLGALTVWKHPYPGITDPSFYGNKIFVLSSCTFDVKNPELSLINLKNIRQLWVSGGVYNGQNRPIFQLSSHAPTGGNSEEQANNTNNLPYIASAFFNFALTSATFPGGYPPYITANCLPHTSCQLVNQTVFEGWVNSVDQPPPTVPTKPTDGSFRFQSGYTNPITGITVA